MLWTCTCNRDMPDKEIWEFWIQIDASEQADNHYYQVTPEEAVTIVKRQRMNGRGTRILTPEGNRNGCPQFMA